MSKSGVGLANEFERELFRDVAQLSGEFEAMSGSRGRETAPGDVARNTLCASSSSVSLLYPAEEGGAKDKALELATLSCCC